MPCSTISLRTKSRISLQGQGLASGVGTGGDAVVDGGAEELLETVGRFEVEGRVFFVTDQQSPPFESAGDPSGDGTQQALEFRSGRGGSGAVPV